MELGVIGLGRMGRIVVDRCLAAGHDVVAFDLEDAVVADVVDAGATAAESVTDLADRLGAEKRVWLMVPAGDAVDASHRPLPDSGAPTPKSARRVSSHAA